MINFREIELKDRTWIEERLKVSDFKGCDYSFANNYIWRLSNHIRIADVEGFYCLKSYWTDHFVYTFPAGNGDLKFIISELLKDAEENNIKFLLRGIPKEMLQPIEDLFPGKFEFTANRDEFDYLYTVDRLSSLAGKKLHGKRNHIARFKDHPNWSYEPITLKNINECYDMNTEWCKLYSGIGDESLNHELCAVKEAFRHFFELNLTGGLLRLDGRVIAYTMGEPLSTDTFIVHIEKAFPDIQGAYPMINQQFVLANCQGYAYVNREEDLGDEGLRKAKLSYYPDILLEKYSATLKG